MNTGEICLIIAVTILIIGTIVGIIIYKKCKNHGDIGIITCGLATILASFISFGAWIFPETRDVSKIIKKEEISAFQDNTYNQIYGKISGGIFYINGEISSTSETYISLVKVGDNGKVDFLNYKLSEVELYLVDKNELEFPYIETSHYLIKEKYIIFGKTIKDTIYSEESNEKIKIYLPTDSLQYDNKIDE